MTVVQDSDHFMYDVSGRCNQSGALISGNGAMYSPLSLAMVQYIPAVLDLPYCKSLARFFCNVVNIHRHRPIARFICNDSRFCAIWPYFDYRYRPNGEFLCNDRSYEDSPANFETKIHPHIMNGTFTLVMSSSVVKSFKKNLLSLSPVVTVLQLELWRRSWQKVHTCISVPFF